MRAWPFKRKRSLEREQSLGSRGRRQELLIICDSTDIVGLEIMNNICATLSFSKLPFIVLDLARHSSWPALEVFSSVIICTERLWQLKPEKASMLEHYLTQGGGLLVAYRSWHAQLGKLFGATDEYLAPGIHVTHGLSFNTELVPGVRGLKVENVDWFFEHSRFNIPFEGLSPDCNILVMDIGDRPLIWSRSIGLGRLVYWNTNVAYSFALRGFFLHTLLETMEIGVAAAGSFAMFHIDDFPPSLSDDQLEPISTEFPNLTSTRFYFDIWHSDMLALRQRHGLKYTWYPVMNYYDVDTGSNADLSLPAVATGREVLERRFAEMAITAPDDEYGFHGYNHEPLISSRWPDLETLRTKLELARTQWEEIVPAPLPRSWVPANNQYHPGYPSVLKQVFPEISAVCSVFSTGEFDLGERRDFGPDPWLDSLLCLPRETYGYQMTPELRMMMLSQIAAMGVWTHFIHPDDIFDIPGEQDDPRHKRNPGKLMWRASNNIGDPGLFSHLDGWISKVRELYPWLEFVTTSTAEKRYRAHVENSVDVVTRERAVDIRTGQRCLFFVRTPSNISIGLLSGGELVDSRSIENGILNVVRCDPGWTTLRILKR